MQNTWHLQSFNTSAEAAVASSCQSWVLYPSLLALEILGTLEKQLTNQIPVHFQWVQLGRRRQQGPLHPLAALRPELL